MKFVAISDTHGCHRQLDLPDGDVLLHSGDVCDRGNKFHVEDFINWLSELDFRYKIIIRGNHDVDLKTKTSLLNQSLPESIIQLDNSGVVIGDIPIWGVPSPLIFGTQSWEEIPLDTQILLTHQPPFSILDQPPVSPSTGNKKLLHKVQTIQPRIHLFGHIHASYGQKQIGNTLFMNASLYKERKKKIVNDAFVFEL